MSNRRGLRFRNTSYPTVEQINTDDITELAIQYWAPSTELKDRKPFDIKIVKDVYAEIVAGRFSSRRLVLLDYTQYLEQFLWPNFDANTSSSTELIMSIVALVNEKKRERASVWHAFKENPARFSMFFKWVYQLSLLETHTSLPDHKHGISLLEKSQLLIFLSHCVNSLEEDVIREQIQRIFGLPIWQSLSRKRLDLELSRVANLRKPWERLMKKDAQKDDITRIDDDFYRNFMRSLMLNFADTLESITETEELTPGTQHYCEQFLNLMIDCQSALNTRRFFHAVMDDAHILVKCRLSALCNRKEGRVFCQLIDALEFYASYEITLTGSDLTEQERSIDHYNRTVALQKIVYSLFTDEEWSRKFATLPVYKVDSRAALRSFLEPLSPDQLQKIADRVGVLGTHSLNSEFDDKKAMAKAVLLEVLIDFHEKRTSQLQRVNEMPIYPTEDIIWNEALVPDEYASSAETMPLPKLHLQFLSLHDYLLRNFQLFRLESAYEIRSDIEDAVARMKPWRNEVGGVVFGGWARMALPINKFEVFDVGKPHVGFKQPSRVRARLTVTANVRGLIRSEWESLRKRDVCFLITVRPARTVQGALDPRDSFVSQAGLLYVRGCEIEGMLDDRGQLIDELAEHKPQLHGETRSYRLWLDPNQYYIDQQSLQAGGEDINQTFNIIMRRKPEENNFKAVLETIRTLINSEWVVPEWLHDVLLGYGDPESVHWTKMKNRLSTLDFNDTFLSMDHLKSCFTEVEVEYKNPSSLPMEPPFRLNFALNEPVGNGKKRDAEGEPLTLPKTLTVEPYVVKRRSPYSDVEYKKNAVPFTPTQIQAIIAGTQHGLTLVVGPPGTGKTDVAVQIISNIYHNFPEQRTIIVTHSNQALNQLFEKIMELNIDERHLLRLGHGEEALETKKDFSRYGRVNYVLAKRLELLSEVGKLQTSLGVTGDVAYTCETAGHFYLYQVLPRWHSFLLKIKQLRASNPNFAGYFPFPNYFADLKPLFSGATYEANMETAESCYRHIENIFTQLEEFRPFELLRSGLDRTRYLLTKEAKIIAMTCTHAGVKRQELIELGFKYDNVLMEEAAQILEVETFIPLLLQKPEHGHNRLKRWIMIGDHNQLPPIVQNKVFEKFCNMEQSLFTRLVRLGVPTVDLDAQGRMRPGLCKLFSWRYKRLGNLPHTYRMPAFTKANAGFAFDYQLIDVADYNGVGESEPSAYFIQNLAEAEFVVGTFMYMRLLGYPSESITILAAYNGQKHLIRDIIEKRCGDNPLIGWPHKIATVDKYQGQQNDYILLSLTRTKTIGYLRDVRRLIVALSRARLGLYVFARAALFQNSLELAPAFSILSERPLQLQLVTNELFPTDRDLDAPLPSEPVVVADMPKFLNFVHEYYRQKLQLMTPVVEATAAGKPDSSDDEDDEDVEEVVETAIPPSSVETMDTSDATPLLPSAQAAKKFQPVEDLPFFPIRGDRGMVVEDGDEDAAESGIK